jgi:hypothetical protein
LTEFTVQSDFTVHSTILLAKSAGWGFHCSNFESNRFHCSRLCAPVAPAALFLPMTTEITSSSWQGRQRGSKRHSGQPRTPRGAVAAILTSVDAPAALQAGARAAAVSPMAAAAQTDADVPTAGLTEIAAFTGGAAPAPRTGTMITMGSRPLSGTSVPAAGGLPSPRPTTSSGPRR